MTTIAALELGLERPWWLLVLLAAPLLAWWALRGQKSTSKAAQRRRAGDLAAVGARSLLLVAVALALALPYVRRDAAYRSVAYVLDVSESVPDEVSVRAREFVRRSAELRGEDDDAALVVFADGASLESPFSRISASERIDDIPIDPEQIGSVLPRGESDVEGALGLARAGFPPGGARRIVLLTDGNETRGSSLPLLDSMADDELDVQIVPLRYERTRDVLVRKLVVASSAPIGRPIPVRAVIDSTHDDVRTVIRFVVDDVEVARDEQTLRKGENVFQLPATFNAGGVHRIEVRVEPELDGDPRNNVGLAATRTEGPGRILYVTDEDDPPAAAVLAEELPVPVDRVGASDLPASIGAYVDYDCIVLDNVPAFGMSGRQRSLLAAAVNDMGVGLLCIGGTQTFGPGGYMGTPIEDVLPVTSDIRQKRVLPSGALVVVLHTCEFPDGNKAGKKIAKAALGALSRHDHFGVLIYGAGVEWAVPLGPVGDRSTQAQQIDSVFPGDMPSFDDALELAESTLAEDTSAAKHIIVISDGDPIPPSPKLAARIHGQRISISTVLVDPHSGNARQVMTKLSGDAGGNHYDVKSSNLSRLPQIFIKEAVTVRRSAWREETFTPVFSGTHTMLRGFGDDGVPSLDGYVVTSAKERAEVLMLGPHDDPLLATWRSGLGAATVWTSDSGGRWASGWVGWGGFGRFVAQVVRATSRALERSEADVTVAVEGGGAHVVLESLLPDGGYENGLRVEGSAVGPDGESVPFQVRQTGQGRYEGEFPAAAVGTYVANLLLHRPDAEPGTPPRQVLGTASVAYSAEHRERTSNERWFTLAENAGATMLDMDTDPVADDGDGAAALDPALLPWQGPLRSAEEPVALWPWLVTLAALLLIADVAVRRLRLRLPRRKATPRAPEPKRPRVRAAERLARPGGAYVAPTTATAEPDATAPKIEDAEANQASGAPSGENSLLAAKKRAKRKQDWKETQ